MTTTTIAPKRLNTFERYLSVWVGLCMAVGLGIGLSAPGLMRGLRGLEFGAESQINVLGRGPENNRLQQCGAEFPGGREPVGWRGP